MSARIYAIFLCFNYIFTYLPYFAYRLYLQHYMSPNTNCLHLCLFGLGICRLTDYTCSLCISSHLLLVRIASAACAYHRICCLCVSHLLLVHIIASAACAYRICCLCISSHLLLVRIASAACAYHRICCLCVSHLLLVHIIASAACAYHICCLCISSHLQFVHIIRM